MYVLALTWCWKDVQSKTAAHINYAQDALFDYQEFAQKQTFLICLLRGIHGVVAATLVFEIF